MTKPLVSALTTHQDWLDLRARALTHTGSAEVGKKLLDMHHEIEDRSTGRSA